MLSHPPTGVLRLVWHPVQRVAQLVHQVRDTAEYVVGRGREAARLVLGALDGLTRQTTRVQTRSEVEWIAGPLTLSVASRVLIARPHDDVPR